MGRMGLITPICDDCGLRLDPRPAEEIVVGLECPSCGSVVIDERDMAQLNLAKRMTWFDGLLMKIFPSLKRYEKEYMMHYDKPSDTTTIKPVNNE